MQKSKIEWCDYSLNPVKGICKYNCPYCYAIRMYKRFKWNPEIRLDENAFDGIENLKAGSKIFVGSTHDIFGDWIPLDWIRAIIMKAARNPQLTFIFLTKNPKRYSDFDFPKNCWIGYSTTGTLFHKWDYKHMDNIKFVSLEPIKEPMNIYLKDYAQRIDFNWLIVGAETGNRKGKYQFVHEWLWDILDFANKTKIPLFLKDNLGKRLQIKEFPEAIK